MSSFVYSILTRILEHGSDLCFGGCILTGLEETRIQTTNSYNLYEFVFCIRTGIRHFRLHNKHSKSAFRTALAALEQEL